MRRRARRRKQHGRAAGLARDDLDAAALELEAGAARDVERLDAEQRRVARGRRGHVVGLDAHAGEPHSFASPEEAPAREPRALGEGAELGPDDVCGHLAEPAVSKPQSVAASTRRGSPTASAAALDAVGHHLGMLDVVGGGVDDAGDERPCRRAAGGAARRGTRARGAGWPSTAQRADPRLVEERQQVLERRRRECEGRRSCPSRRAGGCGRAAMPAGAWLMASTSSSTKRRKSSSGRSAKSVWRSMARSGRRSAGASRGRRSARTPCAAHRRARSRSPRAMA